MSMEHW